MSDKQIPECRQEVFFNQLGSTGAVVCSCGFATTFTALHPNSESLVQAHFERMHSAKLGTAESLVRNLAREIADAIDSLSFRSGVDDAMRTLDAAFARIPPHLRAPETTSKGESSSVLLQEDLPK